MNQNGSVNMGELIYEFREVGYLKSIEETDVDFEEK